jgi:ankyrin repeat protein
MPRISILCLLLLGSGALRADPLVTDWQRSIQIGDLDFIQRHFRNMPDVDLPSATGKTALMAVCGKRDTELALRLLVAGADVNARNQTAGTPLMYAAASGDEATVRLLLDQGAAVNARSRNGWTALMMAVAKRHDHLTRLLEARGADVNLPDVYGWTPLMRAAYEGYFEIVEALLEQPDLDLERRNDHGQTAMHLAAIQGREEVIRALLAQGARTDVEDFSGRTPREICEELGHGRLARLMSDGTPVDVFD